MSTRVRLRRVERADLAHFVAWFNDPEVRYPLAYIWPMGTAQEESWFAAQLQTEPAVQPFSIDIRQEDAESGWRIVGNMAFHSVDWRNRNAEMGIAIGDKTVWGRGYGTEATRTLVRWGLEELNLNRVWLRVYEDNAAAIRCYEKAGFRVEGRLRQDRYRQGRYLDTLIMGLLRGELVE